MEQLNDTEVKNNNGLDGVFPPHGLGINDIMENNFSIILIMPYIYLNAAQYDNTLFPFALLSYLK